MAQNNEEIMKTNSELIKEVIARDGSAYYSIDENGNLVFMTRDEAFDELANDLLGERQPQSGQ